jgi:DNA-binding transcriptional ArsR family regulator
LLVKPFFWARMAGSTAGQSLSSGLTIGAPSLILKSMLKQRHVDRVFHALGDPTRRAMLERLSRGPVSVSQLAEPLAVSLAAVVQHLQVLEESGVIRTEKVGRVRTCSLAPAGLELAEQWIDERMTLWERRLDRLGELLAEQEAGEPTQKRKKKP